MSNKQAQGPNVGIVIQARMGSERLPGKVLRKLPDGNEILCWVVERCLGAAMAQNVIVATSTQPQDQAIVDFCEKKGYALFRGSEEDVLARYVDCAAAFELDIVVRITSDCPLVDPAIIDASIAKLISSGSDYVHNSRAKKTFPRGLDVEVVKFSALKNIAQLATKKYEREHVTIYFYEHPNDFRIETITAENGYHAPEMRLTVDTVDDFELICSIQRALSSDSFRVSAVEAIGFLRKHPELLQVNRHVVQKPIEGKTI